MLDEMDQDMRVRPSLKRDAILGHVASWGDRRPPSPHYNRTGADCQRGRRFGVARTWNFAAQGLYSAYGIDALPGNPPCTHIQLTNGRTITCSSAPSTAITSAGPGSWWR